MTMFPVYLARKLSALQALLCHPVPKRVALHEHPGTDGVVDAVHTLLAAIPGLEVVSLDVPKIGYSLNALGGVPSVQKRLLAQELAAAQAAELDCLVTVYHTEHRELAAHDAHWPFTVVNYMELVGESMGIVREDVFKRLKTMQDADSILVASAATLAANGVSLEDARTVVVNDLLAD